jgi:hypothetical protein
MVSVLRCCQPQGLYQQQRAAAEPSMHSRWMQAQQPVHT